MHCRPGTSFWHSRSYWKLGITHETRMYEGKTTKPSKVRKKWLMQKTAHTAHSDVPHPLPERHTHIRTLPLPFSSSLSLSSRLFLSLSLSTCGPVDMFYEFSDPDKHALTQTMLQSSGQVNRLRWMIKAPQLQVGQGVASQQPDQESVRQNEVLLLKTTGL